MYSASGTKAYAKIGVESAVMSASNDQLVTLLFDGAISSLVRARLFMLEGNIVKKGESLSKAINIIDNGLKLGLDEASEDDLTRNLASLYRYMVHRLIRANIDNDADGIEEVEKLLRNIADAWKEVSGTTALV
ncbi:flagellar export chaperone FliS [Erwinia persicina]|uniref:flagellar export chaperone FliS n=1 Tax=Erwinia persicina TaxID=55211 RepID=UPI001781D940|nr:flagellar export chaperone FliS [Erwinia persicina]MBD8164607.1 flagellar export chaperone FliS [Erwinia persicina]